MKSTIFATRLLVLSIILVNLSCDSQQSGTDQQTASDSTQSTQSETEVTPFGRFLSHLVHSHPAGSVVKKNDDGTGTVTYPDGTVKQIAASDTTSVKRPSAAGLPIKHSWINFASFYTSPRTLEVASFKGNMVVPENPKNTEGQILYYFTGIQDNDSEPVTILQPVLGFNGNGGHKGWSLASWNCCVSSQPQKSNVITGIQPGDTIYTEISVSVKDGKSIYTVEGTWKDQVASLSFDSGDEVFNWPNVTLEVYDIDECSQFATGPMTFFDLELLTLQGDTIPTIWEVNGQGAACGTELTVQPDRVITIEQSN